MSRTRLWLCVSVATAAAVAVAGALGHSGDSSAATAARDRAVTDMPDDFSGPQVHFLYVVPSDGADGQLDTNGGMEQAVARIERWFETQTGNQGLRVDTHEGVPDITFVRLPHSNAQAMATNPFPLFVIGEDLVAAGFNDPAKVYAVFYDGQSAWSCAGATSPALAKLGAVYLRACGGPQFGTSTGPPGYSEIVLVHEILHAIGFSPRCAPHASKDEWGDHVTDSPTDVMYGPDATHTAPWNSPNAVLDFNHDDYYRAHIPGCPDLSDSPYLMPLHSVSVTASGPGTVTSAPAGIDCPATCTSRFTGQVMLTATPSRGAAFDGWTGACSGKDSTCTLTPSGDAAVEARFIALPHRRTLSLSVRAHRAKGTLRVSDGYTPCGMNVAAIIERRGRSRWSSIRRLRTDSAGTFTASVPVGRASLPGPRSGKDDQRAGVPRGVFTHGYHWSELTQQMRNNVLSVPLEACFSRRGGSRRPPRERRSASRAAGAWRKARSGSPAGLTPVT